MLLPFMFSLWYEKAQTGTAFRLRAWLQGAINARPESCRQVTTRNGWKTFANRVRITLFLYLLQGFKNLPFLTASLHPKREVFVLLWISVLIKQYATGAVA